jgi:ribonuclease G
LAVEILINTTPNLTRVAYVEDGQLSDLKIEQGGSPTLVGSIFKGRVVRVLPGMQAAFIDIGLDRAAFLYVGDVRSDIESIPHVLLDEDEEKPTASASPATEPAQARIQDLLRVGQLIMVQVAKDPMGTKGARVTSHLSLAGRHLVFMPTLKHIGISRRIEESSERERLRSIVEDLKPKGGLIIRTACEGASAASLEADLDYLYRLWSEVERAYEKKKAPGLVHAEIDVELRALRDLLSEKVEKVWVDDPKVFKKVGNFVSQFMPKYRSTIVLHEGNSPLFDLYDIDLEISRALDRKIWLKSGGYIVVDEAEALVVIDVNTGKFVGKKDLEDTIFKTNMEAVKEIAHQLRIRNCGGIIIIDLIDMEKPGHREKVLNQLRQELARDLARTTIVTMSDLGLVEMTRKRIRPSLVSTLCEPCPYCEGNGYVKRSSTVAQDIFQALDREGKRNPNDKNAIVIHCHRDVADWMYSEGQEALEAVEQRLSRSIVLRVEANYHIEQFELTGPLQPQKS